MANSFIFLATGTSLQGLSLFTLSITLNFGFIFWF
ncbi:BnaC06g42610D [Brassica napus]|uniref:BnaC06g42610D protein n=1 Tax=Brassica napus TaxID=3708 RepID=A0A078J4W0_BRANA|nr:BnaC06g42610D [Brassica napus]